jgi:hypothetical protein
MPLDSGAVPYRLNPHRRLRCENVDIDLEQPLPNGETARHRLTVSLAYDGAGVLREVVFVGRGRIGSGIDIMLHDLGVKLSRVIQGRSPTGRPAPDQILP